MMRSSEWDFDIPQRQSYVAILLIIYKYYKIIVRQLWPVLLIIIFNGKGGKSQYFLYLILGLGLISMVFAIIAYFKYYFYLKGDELIIEKGVFKKTKINIPLDRVQTINKEQNLIHRLFSVVKLKIDTAGSVKNEFELDALSEDKADALRNLLLSKKPAKLIQNDEAFDTPTPLTYPDYHEVIMRLSVLDLIKVGISQNHIQSGGLIIAFMFGIYNNLEEAGLRPDEYGVEIPELSWDMGIFALLFFVSLFFTISFIVSLIRTFLINYDLKFTRQQEGFKVNHGLLNRKEFSALDRKIQIMTWSDSLLKKLFNINDLVLKQASSIAVNAKKAIAIPGCTPDNIQRVYQYYFGEIEIDEEKFEEVDIRFFYRKAIIYSILALIILAIGLSTGKHVVLFIGIFLLGYWLLDIYLLYQKLRYYVSEKIIRIHGGSYGDKHNVLHTHKIQAVKIIQTPYQTRKNLASLHLYTASGVMKIPYISLAKATAIHDFLLYTVERSKEDWM